MLILPELIFLFAFSKHHDAHNAYISIVIQKNIDYSICLFLIYEWFNFDTKGSITVFANSYWADFFVSYSKHYDAHNAYFSICPIRKYWFLKLAFSVYEWRRSDTKYLVKGFVNTPRADFFCLHIQNIMMPIMHTSV